MIDARVQQAKDAYVTFIAIRAALGWTENDIATILYPGWPEPLKQAFSVWQYAIRDVAKCLAEEAGSQRWELYIREAFERFAS